MRLLSRYVLSRYVQPMVFSSAAFVAIFIVADLANRISAFLDREVGLASIAAYYAWSIPYFVLVTLPMASLLASLFCLGGLARQNELAAMKSAGIPLLRIVAPVLAFAVLVSAIALGLSQDAIPFANRHRASFDEGAQRVTSGRRAQVVVRDVGGRVLTLAEYLPEQTLGRRATLDRYEGRALSRKVRAEEIVWVDSVWVFVRGETRTFREREMVVPFDSLAVPALTLKPPDLSRESRSADQLSHQALVQLIERRVRNGGEALRERVDLELRSSFACAAFVMVLLGVPLSSYTRRAGRPLQVGVCLLTSFVFYGAIQASRAMGWNGILDPVAAAWAPNAVFLAVGILMFRRAHT